MNAHHYFFREGTLINHIYFPIFWYLLMNYYFRSNDYDSRVCMDCPFDGDDPNNQYYINYGPHNLTECIKAEPTCPDGLIRINGNITTNRR